MNTKLSLKKRITLLVLFLVAFPIGDFLWLTFSPTTYDGVWIWVLEERYEEAAPAWVSDGRLVHDAANNYFYWNNDTSLSWDGIVLIYEADVKTYGKRYYDCSAVLWYDGKLSLRVKPDPWEASEECYRWATDLKFRVYRGTITVEGDRKVIRMERDRAFQHEIILVPPAE